MKSLRFLAVLALSVCLGGIAFAENAADFLAADLGENEAEEEEGQDFYSMMFGLYDSVLRQTATALTEHWEPERLAENGLCPLLANLTPDEVMADCICLGNDEVVSDYALILYTESESIDLLSMAVLSGDPFRLVLTASDRNRYTLLRDDEGYVIAQQSSDSGMLYWRVSPAGDQTLIEGSEVGYEKPENVLGGATMAEYLWFNMEE